MRPKISRAESFMSWRVNCLILDVGLSEMKPTCPSTMHSCLRISETVDIDLKPGKEKDHN